MSQSNRVRFYIEYHLLYRGKKCLVIHRATPKKKMLSHDYLTLHLQGSCIRKRIFLENQVTVSTKYYFKQKTQTNRFDPIYSDI